MTQSQEKNQSVGTDPERAVMMESEEKEFLKANLNTIYMLKGVDEHTNTR